MAALYVYLLIEYVPLMGVSAYGSLDNFISTYSQYSTSQDWQKVDRELKLKSKKLDYDVEAIGLDIPDAKNPSGVLSSINQLILKHKIKSHDLEFLNYSNVGRYKRWPIKLDFNAHYRDGIRFLHALETHKKLVRINSISIENKDNKKRRPIQFETVIELILLGEDSDGK